MMDETFQGHESSRYKCKTGSTGSGQNCNKDMNQYFKEVITERTVCVLPFLGS